MSDEAELARAIRSCERLRRPYLPESDRGPFIVTGNPKQWASATRTLRDAGVEIVAYQDLRWRHRWPFLAGRPVIPGRRLGPLSRYPLLYVGPPRKTWFDGCAPELERCVWHEAPTAWRANSKENPALMEQHGDALAQVFGSLHDDASRRTYAALIRSRMEGSSDYYRISPYAEYDHPIVRARPGDVVIDAGAFDGDSARAFAWSMRGRGTIVALEPVAENFEKLRRRRIPGLRAVPVGAWHRNETLEFANEGGSSRALDGGGTKVDVVSIDSLVREMKLPRVDLLKLDVEGAEREALEGAEATLLEHRPKLQISIYHKANDLFELPQWVQSRLEGYRYYVGHHSFYVTETDLYAIPEERL